MHFLRKQKIEPSISKVSSPQVKEKAAAPIDFFGSSKVKKDSKPVVKKCEKPANEKSLKDNSTIEIDDFSDEEAFEDPSFMETLDKLDKKKEKVGYMAL